MADYFVVPPCEDRYGAIRCSLFALHYLMKEKNVIANAVKKSVEFVCRIYKSLRFARDDVFKKMFNLRYLQFYQALRLPF